MTKKYTEISKFLSYVLRHDPESIGLKLDSEGWANISELISCANSARKQLNKELIQQVEKTSDKKRFAISEDGLRIRAVQGHSIKTVDIQFIEKIPPEFLYHGTATRFLEFIQKEGLKPQQRQYVHLSENEQTAMEAGQRYGKPVILKIEACVCSNMALSFFWLRMGCG